MRRLVVIVLALVLVLAAAWSGFWVYMANRIPADVASWAAQQRTEGRIAEYGALSVHGFPLSWRVIIDRPAMAGAGPTNWEWRGDAVVAEIQPWAPRDIPLELPGMHRLSAGAGNIAETAVLRAGRPDGRIAIGADGKLERLTLDLHDAEIRRLPDTEVTRAQQVMVHLAPHRVAAPTHRTDVLDLTMTAMHVKLPSPPLSGFGEYVARAHLDLSFKGALPPGPLRESVAAWRDDGGTIEISRVALLWGPLDIDGDGTLALDAQNRPLGAFTARIRGYAEAVDAMSQAGVVRPREAASIKVALNLLARQAHPGAARELNVPLTAQDGRLSVAGFAFAKLPPLELN